jgi:hydroxymethylpyrimidine/phosphomethylpyrimidine kinase
MSEQPRPPIALTVAGSDPTGGAGLQLDLRVFQAHAVHGLAVPTAITVQSTQRVHRVLPAFPSVVDEQLRVLLADIVPDAIKIGMLATDDVLLRVADLLARQPAPRVVDPVLRASDGTWLLERRALMNLMERVIRGAALVTPNLDEAELLVGTRDPEAAAAALLECGADAALIKGGHREGAPDDYLRTREGGRWLRAELRHPGPVHGTGCALSSAIAARLARGERLGEAVPAAKRWLETALGRARALGRGQLLLQPEPG